MDAINRWYTSLNEHYVYRPTACRLLVEIYYTLRARRSEFELSENNWGFGRSYWPPDYDR